MSTLVEQKIPFLSEEMNDLTVSKVFVSENDEVEQGQPLIEIDTDKATVEIASDFTGTVDSFAVQRGDVVKPGDLMCTILAQKETSIEEYSQFMSTLKSSLALDDASSFDDILRTVEELKRKN